MGDGENGKNEQRRRQRQIGRQLIFLEALRPIAHERHKVGQAEQHGFNGEQFAEKGEEGRHPPSRQRRDRREPRGDRDQQRHFVFFICADDEGEDGEERETQHAHGRGTLSGRQESENAH